jgi:hypothetical protein
MKSIYLIGSLRNPEIPKIAQRIRALGFDVFDDWYAPGPQADDYWRDYSKARGQSYAEALNSWAAKHVFETDKHHLDRCDMAVMVHPAGRSCHLELGYMAGCGKPTFILLDDPERWDVMVQFADYWFFDLDDLLGELRYHA